MKSERRHELQTNELADWISNFPQWFQDNLATVIVGAVVVVGLIAYTIFFYHRESSVWDQKSAQTTALLDQLRWQKQTVIQGKNQGLGVSDFFLNTASGLETAATETQNDILSALAMIKRAEALRTELHYRTQIAEPDVQKFQLEQAQKLYAQALEKAKTSPTVAAMAEYGTALCLEDKGDFAGAKKLYDKIAQAPEYKGTLYPARAKLRAETMSDNQIKVVFAKAEKTEQPAPETVKQPIGPLELETPSSGTKATTGADANSAK